MNDLERFYHNLRKLPPPHYDSGKGHVLYHGDNAELLPLLRPGSVDSIVTDPPAGISFMGRNWDGDKGGRDRWVDWLEGVMAGCLRAAKPGAHALVWALPRTSHWTGWAVEGAGWEIRDCVTHLFSSGFPKGRNIAKAIDNRLGAERNTIERVRIDGKKQGKKITGYLYDGSMNPAVASGPPITDEARAFDGWNTALKPASETWWLAMKPFDGTYAENALQHGVAGLNVDGCRIPLAGDEDLSAVQNGRIYRDGEKYEIGMQKQTTLLCKPNGRWPANIILSHDAGCEDGRCVEGCPVRMLDEQSGKTSGRESDYELRINTNTRGGVGATSFRGGGVKSGIYFGDSGGASRFFYVAKPSKSEREKQNIHPTVKSIKLMQWLCRLTATPKGGVVLDPFLGSGTTMVAAYREKRFCIGFEQSEEYAEIAAKRMRNAVRKAGLNL